MTVSHDGVRIPYLQQTIGPDAQLIFGMDWSSWLSQGAIINSANWNLHSDPDLTILFAVVESGSLAKVHLQGFQPKTLYLLTCEIETNVQASGFPEKESRSFEVWCERI